VLWCRHRGVALTIYPEEPIEQRGVDGIGTAEIEILAFPPFLGIHLIDQAVVAVAIVGGERGLLTGPAEERGHDRGALVVRIHWRFGQLRAHRDHKELPAARYLKHVQVPVAVAGVKRLDRSGDQKIALPGVAHTFAARCASIQWLLSATNSAFPEDTNLSAARRPVRYRIKQPVS
jgi:hypothetical protein